MSDSAENQIPADAENLIAAQGETPVDEALRQSRKMEALGRLAGGVAHDFNNLLTAINGYADLLLAALDKSDPNFELAEEIRKAGEKGSQLTRQLLAFSRKQSVELKEQDLRPLVDGMEKLLRRLLPATVQLECDLPKDPQWARIDRGLVEQAIMNLVVNARDASPRGGMIRITVSTQTIHQWPGSAPLKPQPGDFVLLAVHDQGLGMSSDVQAHLFEPFFTTKGKGKGTGLGLSTVFAVMQQLEGGLLVESAEGAGSTFTLCLPAVRGGAETESVAHEMHAPLGPAGHGERLALLEKDAAIRQLARRVLNQVGYQVVELSGVLSVAAASEFDAVVCGVQGDFSSPEAARTLARQWLQEGHARGVVFLGADPIPLQSSPKGLGAKPSGENKICFLAKPFATGDLLQSLRQVLDV